MIKIKNLSNKTEHTLVPTIFPDKTSQVWKLPEELMIRSSKFKVIWHFESEAEIMHIFQLFGLLRTIGNVVELFIPYMPYARQDKDISNEATFAQYSFFRHVIGGNSVSPTISVFDIHNPSVCEINNITNISPNKYIVKSMINSQADLICYPDAGASKRYGELADFVVADKTRDQLTGAITGHHLLESKHSIEGKTVLVVDDLGDGMGTFISIAKLLYAQGAKDVQVYISHGIFSKGVVLPTELGKISHYYTTDSFLPSQQMLKQHSNVTVYNLEE
jgi:ribose-phosphate pyrophosphokinase